MKVTMNRIPIQLAILTFFLLLTSGCATLQPTIEKPKVSLSSFRLVDVQLFEQVFELSLRIQNLNQFPLEIDSLKYRLQFNDSEFAHGVSRQKVNIPAMGEEIVQLSLVTSLSKIVRQFQFLMSNKKSAINYQLTGQLNLGNFPLAIPFDKSGELPKLAL